MTYHPLAPHLLEQIRHFSTYDELMLALDLGLIQGPWRHHSYSGSLSTHWWNLDNGFEESFVAVRADMNTQVVHLIRGFSGRAWFGNPQQAYEAVLGAQNAKANP